MVNAVEQEERRRARIAELKEEQRQKDVMTGYESPEAPMMGDPELESEPEPVSLPPRRPQGRPRRQATPVEDMAGLRARLLQHLSAAEQELISDEDLLAIKAKQDKKAADERKKDVLERLEADMLHRARVDQELLSASTLRTAAERARLAEKVMVKIELPGGGAGQHTNGFRIDGRLYQVGNEYEVTRAELESMQDTHYRVHVNEIRFSTLDQDKKAGISLNNRAMGTTAANTLFAQAPVRLEVRDVD
jgi:hypothetical protein